MASIALIGCTSPKMIFKPANSSLSQFDYYAAKEDCGKTDKSRGFVDCMKAKGWICTSNCPDSSSETAVIKKEQKQVDFQVLVKWAEAIRAEQEREWILYTKSQEGLLFYYSPASLSAVGQRYIYFRDQVKYPSNWTRDLSYVWRSVKVNCTEKMFELSDFLALNKAGKPTDPKASETAWAHLPEESPLGTFAFKMCRERITQGAESNRQGDPSSVRDK